jgi:hypothetical protein
LQYHNTGSVDLQEVAAAAVGGALLAPLVVATAGEALMGVGLMSGSTTAFTAGLAAYGAATGATTAAAATDELPTEANRVGQMVANTPADEAVAQLQNDGYIFGEPNTFGSNNIPQIKGISPDGSTEVRLHGADPRYPNDPSAMWRIGTNFGSNPPSSLPSNYIQSYGGNNYAYVNQLGEYGPYTQSATVYPSTHIPAVPPTSGNWPHIK